MQNLISAFPVLCFCVALVLGFLDVPQPLGCKDLSPYTQWMLSLGLGVPSLWAALSHAVFADRVAQSIGWAPSPFQKEIAGANLGIGLGAIAASALGPEAAWAMTIMAAGFLWSAAATHVADMVRRKNFAINNAGPIFWWDILTPLALFVILLLGAGGTPRS
jgi:hypothetical protein